MSEAELGPKRDLRLVALASTTELSINSMREPLPEGELARIFRRAWLIEFSPLAGPATAILTVWMLWRAGWPSVGIAVGTLYIAFNVVWSELEGRNHRITRDNHLRAWINGSIHFTLYTQLGDVPGAWTLMLATVFGSMGSATVRHARAIVYASLAGFTLGSTLAGVDWQAALTELCGLTLIAVITERLYEPLVEGAVDAHEREKALHRANTSLEQALDARKVFLATMSHEIRTPMNGVLGMAELLERTTLDAEQRRMLGVLRASGRGLLQVINDVLDISKLEAGKMQIEVVPTDVAQLGREVLELLRHASRSEGLALELHAQGLPSALAVDPTRLRQVLLNLVGNACKFTAEGYVHVRMRWAAARIEIEVEDTGIGISEEARAQLFQPFAQADASTTRHYGGTGLGLAICRRLVGLMGGELKVRSRVGEGSTFFFTIDAAAVEQVLATPAVAEVEPPPCLRVLLVDDNAVNLMVASSMLQKLGSEVVSVSGGVKALAQLEQDDGFDLILLDCQMPEMDGFETCRRLRTGGWTKPVLALTAGVTADEQQQCREAGMDDVLFKPATLESIGAALSRWAPEGGGL